jgi:hypothetical protein
MPRTPPRSGGLLYTFVLALTSMCDRWRTSPVARPHVET